LAAGLTGGEAFFFEELKSGLDFFTGGLTGFF